MWKPLLVVYIVVAMLFHMQYACHWYAVKSQVVWLAIMMILNSPPFCKSSQAQRRRISIWQLFLCEGLTGASGLAEHTAPMDLQCKLRTWNVDRWRTKVLASGIRFQIEDQPMAYFSRSGLEFKHSSQVMSNTTFFFVNCIVRPL